MTSETIQERFERFDSLNPWVYDRLVYMTRELKDRGRTKVGIGMLTEVLRWETWRSTTDPTSDFKINNVYRSRYVRKIIDENPDLDGMFEIRRLKSP